MHDRSRQAWEASRPGVDHAVDAVCIAPWVSLELDPSGLVYGCCANQLYPLGRIGEDRLTDIWGGPRASVLRESLGRWDMSVGCGSCRWHLERGRTDPDAAVYDRYPLDVAQPDGPVAMTFALSNRCNLACVMCTPELSSTLRRRAGLPAISSPYDDEFFDDLARFIPGLRYAKFLGGEPFLIPEHHRVWDLMLAAGSPPKIQVTTNGTVWNERVESVLDGFDVDVTVSIDGATKQTYESIRGGADFGLVVANIDRFRRRCADAGTEFRFCFCLMANNWWELPAFLAWAHDLDAEVSVNVVSDEGLALHDLGLSELEEVAASWERAGRQLSLGLSTSQVWETQRRQLDAVIAERRSGVAPPPRQAQRVTGAVLSSGEHPSAALPADAVERLRAWSGNGPVGVVSLDRLGSITAVEQPLAALGVTAGLVGRSMDEVLAVMEAADGRPAWLIGMSTEEGVAVRTLVLSDQQPVRGAAGLIVRMELGRTDDGWDLLLAADAFYDRAAEGATPVALRAGEAQSSGLDQQLPGGRATATSTEA